MELAQGQRGTPGGNGSNSNPRNTPYTVDEALPFSPLSSIVPFDSGIIALPTIGTRNSKSIYTSTAERDAAYQDLATLNNLAADAQSHILQRTLRDLKVLLRPEETTQFQFAGRFGQGPDSHAPQAAANAIPPKINLSPFAKMVFNMADPPYLVNYPVTKPSRKSNVNGAKAKHVSTNPKYTPITTNNQSFNCNSTIHVNVPGATANTYVPAPTPQVSRSEIATITTTAATPRPRQNCNSEPQLRVEIKIPPAPRKSPKQTPKASPFAARPSVESNTQISVPASVPNPEAWIEVPESADVKSTAGRNRKRSFEVDDAPLTAIGIDQRQKADAAVRNLKDYMLDIFKAEDKDGPDSRTRSTLFTTAAVESETTLAAATHSKLELLIQKTISVGRFVDLPIEDLVRIQKLSEAALKTVETMNLKIDQAWDASDVEAWILELSTAELGLKSSHTSLRLMTGGREDKQIYSEEIIQSSVTGLRNVLDSCIIPVVELRSTGTSANLFKLLSAEKKTIAIVLSRCRRLLSLISDLVGTIELSETVINGLEFLVMQLIFVENAHVEKDSVLGTQKFDHLRLVAMEVLSSIFLKHPPQRQGIFDEILTSLEKLPVSKQSARQFKLPDGGSIQLVSGLIMRLVQTSASKVDESTSTRKGRLMAAMTVNGEDDDDDSASEIVKTSVPKRNASSHDTEKRAMEQSTKAVQQLKDLAAPLIDAAGRNAHYVVNFIVTRAMGSTKTGDSPYRNLLDLFVEDFITCLRLSDWPGAELLLRLLLIKTVKISDDPKSTAPAKNMALDLLAVMASAISELNSQIRKSVDAMANSESESGIFWVQLAEIALEGKSNVDGLMIWSGPYRASLEYLNERCSRDSQLRSGLGFFAASWASQLCANYEKLGNDEDEDYEQKSEDYGRAAYRLRMIIGDRNWLSAEGNSIESSHGRLAYSITLLNSPFCNYFERALIILLNGMGSDQATVRSKSLRSVTQVLETDPTILDRGTFIKTRIVTCVSEDPSVQVRDSALGLVGKCISLRPALESEMIPVILQRVNDSSIGVRKRAMKLSKDIYLRNKDTDIRSSIADALIHRVVDNDEGVQDLARQTIEEVWMSPFYRKVDAKDSDLSVQFKIAMSEHVDLMVRTVQRRSGVASVLDKILQSMLSNDSKNPVANFRVCKILVATMFDTFIDNPNRENSSAPDAKESLIILQIFAKADPKLFTVDQIQLLQPFISNLDFSDDLTIYQSIIVIFRHVLPQLSNAHDNLLTAIKVLLMKAVSRHKKSILDDIVACLWIISGILQNSDGLMRLAISTIKGAQGCEGADLKDPTKAGIKAKLQKYMLIGGIIGKHCDLDSHIGGKFFKDSFPSFRGPSFSTLMVDTYAPFSSPDQPMDVRRSALDSMCSVSQAWPQCFQKANVYTAFEQAFEDNASDLIYTIMSGFKAFLVLEERRSEPDAELPAGAAQDSVATLGVMGGNKNDGIATAMTQRFLPRITAIALSSLGEDALLATEIVGSVNRQGLVHPKECINTFVALETSPNTKIAEVAFREHRAAHIKHETLLEKVYMVAVQAAFAYQHDTVKDSRGAVGQPLTSKLSLLMEVFKMSKAKNRKSFFQKMCKRVDFDPTKIDTTADLPPHLEYSRFLVENLAFFEYSTVDELLATLSAMDHVASGTGAGIAHGIETEVFQIRLNQSSQMNAEGQEVIVQADERVSPARLRHLTACSMVLSAVWETRSIIRKLYGLNANTNKSKEAKAKAIAKDLNKQPVRVPGVTGDRYWEDMNVIMSALSSQEAMMEQCRAFVDLMTVDREFKIAAEEADDVTATNGRVSTPSDDEDDEEPREQKSGSGRGRKTKSEDLTGSKSGRGRLKKRARSSSHGPSGKKARRGSSERVADGQGDWA